MSLDTNPNSTKTYAEAFNEDEKRQYGSFLFECGECGQRTVTSFAGGSLNPCLKQDVADQHCGNDGHDILVTALIGGFADTPVSVASLEGRKPGEPARENAWQPRKAA